MGGLAPGNQFGNRTLPLKLQASGLEDPAVVLQRLSEIPWRCRSFLALKHFCLVEKAKVTRRQHPIVDLASHSFENIRAFRVGGHVLIGLEWKVWARVPLVAISLVAHVADHLRPGIKPVTYSEHVVSKFNISFSMTEYRSALHMVERVDSRQE